MSPTAVLRALAEPRRQTMLRLVRDRPRSVNEIASHFDITQQAVSQHLQVLKRAGLVQMSRQGQRRLYSVRPEGLEPLDRFLADLWPAGLEGSSELWRPTVAPEPYRDSVLIDAQPERVFTYFTDPDRLVLWIGGRAVLDPRPGGEFKLYI